MNENTIASPQALCKRFSLANYNTVLPSGSWAWVWLPSHSGWFKGRIKNPNSPCGGQLLVDVILPNDLATELKAQVAENLFPVLGPSKLVQPSGLSLSRTLTQARESATSTVSLMVPRWNIIPYDIVSRTYEDALADFPYPKFSGPLSITLEDVSFVKRHDNISIVSLISERLKHGRFYTSIGNHVLIALRPSKEEETPFASNIHQIYALNSIADLEPHPLLIARSARDNLRTASSQAIILLGPPGGGKAFTAKHIVSFFSQQDLFSRKATGRQQLLFMEVEACFTVMLALTQRSSESSSTASFLGMVFRVTFDTLGDRALGLKIAVWAHDLAPLSANLRHKDERLPHIFYSFLISVVALEQQGAFPETAFLQPFDALAVLKFLPPPLHDEKEIHIKHFTQLVSAFDTLGFTETDVSDILRIIFVVSLTDAASTSISRGRGLELSEALTSGNMAATLALHLGIPDMELDLQMLIEKQPDILFRLGSCLFQRLLLYLISRINDCLHHEPRQYDTYHINESELSTITIISAPGYTKTSGTLSDLLKNISHDALMNWFVADQIESIKERAIEASMPTSCIPELDDDVEELIRTYIDPKAGLFATLDMSDLEFRTQEILWRQHEQQKRSAAVQISGKPVTRGNTLNTTTQSLQHENPYTTQYFGYLATTFVERLSRNLKESSCFRFKDNDSTHFIINHSCGAVTYSAIQFANDNAIMRLPLPLSEFLRRSDDPLLASLIRRSSPTISGVSSYITNSNDATKFRFVTLTNHLKLMLDDLSSIVALSSPCFYIYCIPSNGAAFTNKTDVNYILKQLKLYNILKLAQMYQTLFPIHFTHYDFVETFLPIVIFNQQLFLSLRYDRVPQRSSARLLAEIGISPAGYWFGFNLILLSRPTAISLEQRRHKIISVLVPSVKTLEKAWKTFVPRIQRHKLIQSTIRLQSSIRRALSAKHHWKETQLTSILLGLSLLLSATYIPPDTLTLPRDLKNAGLERDAEVQAYMVTAATQLQAWWRSLRAMRLVENLRLEKARKLSIGDLQNLCQRYLAQVYIMGQFAEQKLMGYNVSMLQAHVRGWLQRRKFRKLTKLRIAIIPIKRISRRIIALQYRIHMLKALSQNHTYRNILKASRNLAYAATIIQKSWRGHFVRSQYKVLRYHAMQCANFGLLKFNRIKFISTISKIVLIQRWWRALHALTKNTNNWFPQSVKIEDQNVSSDNIKLYRIKREEYFRKEAAAFNLLHTPCILYQAFWKQSRLRDIARDCFICLRLQIDKPALDIYPQGWAWPLVSILHRRAEVSWDCQKLQDAKLASFDAAFMLERGSSSFEIEQLELQNKRRSSKTDEQLSKQIAVAALTQAPRLLTIEQICVGGHHSLILLTEFNLINDDDFDSGESPFNGPYSSSSTVSKYNAYDNNKRLSEFHHGYVKKRKYRWTTHVFSWGWNDRGQLGCSQRFNNRQRNSHDSVLQTSKENPYCFNYCVNTMRHIQPIRFEDYHSTTYQDPHTGNMIENPHQSLNYTHDIKLIGAGDDHSIAMTTEGLLFSWGDNSFGQCGHGPKYLKIMEPQVVESLRPITVNSISVGARHCMALSPEGHVYIWGAFSHIGLNTIPPRCNIYYPIQIQLRDSLGVPEKCIGIKCGTGFNMALSIDPYCIKIWGRNDCGQLGLGQDKQQFIGYPVDLVISDIPRAPTAYLRVSHISCGTNFAAACVRPSKGRLFLWGAFRIYDSNETIDSQSQQIPSAVSALGLKKNSFLAQMGGNLKKNVSPADKEPSSIKRPIADNGKILAIREPTAVSHDLWAGMAVVQVACGYISNISISLENEDVYGFDAVRVIWYLKDTKSAKSKSDEDDDDNGYRKLQTAPFNLNIRKELTQTTAVNQRKSEKKSKPKPLTLKTLKGTFHLEPLLYQYKHIRPGTTTPKNLGASYNSKGLQLTYLIGMCRHPELERPAPLSDTGFIELSVFPVGSESIAILPASPLLSPTADTISTSIPGTKLDMLRTPATHARISRGAAYLRPVEKKVEPKKSAAKHVIASKSVAYQPQPIIKVVKDKVNPPKDKTPPPLKSSLQKKVVTFTSRLPNESCVSGMSIDEISSTSRLVEMLFGGAIL